MAREVPTDFKSVASANSATPAYRKNITGFNGKKKSFPGTPVLPGIKKSDTMPD